MESSPDQSDVIIITVKTLDGQNRTFHVAETLNVRQFKEKISASVEIPADTQRLIFQGRVMQDDKVLKDYNVHGKVVHLVQRPPPSTLANTTTTSTTSTSSPSTTRPQIQLDGNLFDVQIHVGRLQTTPNTNEARARLRQAEFDLRIINDVLSQFEQSRQAEEASVGSQDTPTSRYTSAAAAMVENFSVNRMDTSPPTVQRSPPEARDISQPNSSEPAGGAGVEQQSGLMASDLANFLDQVLDVYTRVMTYIRQYQDLLRNEVNYPENSREVQNAQEVVNRVSEIFHALGHMLHNLSDISVDMSSNVPRQATALPPAPFPLPGTSGVAIPIHMNVRSRQDANRSRHRPGQTATSTAQTSESRMPGQCVTSSAQASTTRTRTTSTGFEPNEPNPGAAPATNTTSAAAAGFQGPPVTLSESAPSGDSTVTVEVYPTSLTVHDIRATVTQGGMDVDVDSDSISDSQDSLAGNRPDVTVRTSTTIEHSFELPITGSTVTTTAAPPYQTTSSLPPLSTQQTSTSQFPASTSTSSTITFGPTTTVSFGGVTNLGSGQLPNVPGLPPDMLQNILGSILNSHGLRSGQPVHVNVVQQLTTSGGSPSRPSPQQLIQDFALDNARSRPHNQQEGVTQPRSQIHSSRVDASLQTTSSVDDSTRTSVNVGTNTTSAGATNITNASTNTTIGTNAATSTAGRPGNSVFTSIFNVPNIGSQRNTSTGTDPSMGTSSRSTNTPRRPFVFHSGSPRQPRQTTTNARPQQPSSLRTGPGSHGYVDPYLPCASPQYSSPTALAALSSLHGQSRSQQAQQQVPNLSTMVSGMVGEIIGQVGQAAQQALNNAARTSSSTTFTSASPSSSGSGASVNDIIGAGNAPNLLNLLTQLFSLTMDSSQNQGNPLPPVIGTMVNSIMQAMSTSATTPAAGQGAAPTSDWTLADLFSQFRGANEDRAGETGLIVSLLESVAPFMRIVDLISLVMGNDQVLSRLKGPLQEFLKLQIDHYGSVEQVVEVALSDMSSDIQYIQGLVQVREGVDMAQTINNCLRAHLRTIFTAILSDSSGPQGNFGSHLYSLLMKMLAETVGLSIYCISDGRTGFFNMLHNYVPRITQGMNPMFAIWMSEALQSILGSFIASHPVQESDIIGYVVKQEQKTESSQQAGNPTEKVSAGASVASLVGNTSSLNSSSPGPVGTDKPVAQTLKAEVSGILKEEESEANETFEDAQETLTNHEPHVNHPSTLSTRVRHTEEGAVGGSKEVNSGRSVDNWQSVIPQEWIPVISQDIVKQQEQRPQPPFSDAYLQGLPAKRRRMMASEHAHEMGNLPLYLPDAIRRAARTVGVEPYSSEDKLAQEAADNHDLQNELEREMRVMLESRINSDSDFNPDRFPNAEEYFHKSKHH